MPNSEMKTFVVPVEWKAADDGTVEGYASTFGNVDLQGDVVVKGAFKKTISERVKNGDVALLADHNPSTRDVLGTVIQAREDEKGLRFRAKFSSVASAQEVRTKLLEGHLKKLSIGYSPINWEYGRGKDDEPVRLLKEVKLYEVSVVVFPANPQAAVSSVKAAIDQLAEQEGHDDVEDVRELLQQAINRLSKDEDKATDRGNIDTPDAADLNSAARRYAASRGWALPNGSYPIRPRNMHGETDLGKAIRAVGRGLSPHDTIRRHIMKRARALGLSDRIPDGWTSQSADEGAETLDTTNVEYPFDTASLEIDPGQESKTDDTEVETGHQETHHEHESVDTGEQEKPAKQPLSALTAAADALLEGRAWEGTADPVQMAGLTTRLDHNETEIARLNEMLDLNEQILSLEQRRSGLREPSLSERLDALNNTDDE